MKFWAMVSGGKDSVTLAHVLAERGELEGIFHIDTGIAAPDVAPFVRQLCEREGWPLEIIRTPKSYEWLVRKYGFPGPGGHIYAVTYLKGRAIRLFKKAHRDAILASGVRTEESVRRMGTAKAVQKLEGLPIHAPILDWTTRQVWDYIHDQNLEVSPAYWNLHISGDCLCGAYAQPDEVYLLETFYPELAARIRRLEAELQGRPRCRWGQGEGFGQQSRIESWLCQGCTVRA